MNAVLSETPPASADERIVIALLARGKLKEADLIRARRLQEQDGGSLLTLLGRLGLVSERDHAEVCASELGLPLRSARDVPELPPEDTALGVKFMKQFHIVPVATDGDAVDVLLADPQDPYVLDAVRLATARDVRPAVALRSEIDELIERWHGQGRSAMEGIVDTAEGEEGFDDVEHLRDLASEAPVIRLVNLVIQRAVELRASDIHIEPFENRLKVRYRIDGVLEEGESPPPNLTAAVISRIKIMAKLNIAERRLPQDGRIMQRVQGKEL
ncbi:MAG: GspE/PulE family protein, partial [Thermomonas sp.]